MGNLEVTLHKVATITMGTSPKGTTYNHEGIGLPLLNGPTEFGATHPHCTLYTTDSRKECKAGDLIFCVRGSTTGRMNWADQTYSVGRGVCSLRGETPLDTKYIRYCIEWKLNSLLSLAGGSTFPNLTKDMIRDFPIPYLEARHKIAAVLRAYDDLIESNTRRIKILEEMASAIYREWFVEFRFPGHEGVEMVESGLIPQGWEVKQLGDVTSVITKGTTPTTLGKQFVSEGINFIKVQSIDERGDILDSKLAKIDDKTHKLLKRSQLQENDILFSIAGAIGRVTTLPKRFLPANTNQALAIIRPSDLSLTAYLYRTLRSSEFLNYSLERVVQTAQANVSLSVLSSAPVIMPIKVVLDDFNQQLTPITNLVDRLREKNTNLRQTRDLLLPKLISGEIDVSELNIDTN